MLEEGATWFCADDHEYWNNFPNAATLISATWTASGRDRYRRIAGSLYEVIASPSALVFGNHSQTERAPARFPAKLNARSRLRVRTCGASRYAGDNLATLEFSQVPGQVRVKLKYWYVQTGQSGPTLEFALTWSYPR